MRKSSKNDSSKWCKTCIFFKVVIKFFSCLMFLFSKYAQVYFHDDNNAVKTQLKLRAVAVNRLTRSKLSPNSKNIIAFYFRKLFLFSFSFLWGNIFVFSFTVYFFKIVYSYSHVWVLELLVQRVTTRSFQSTFLKIQSLHSCQVSAITKYLNCGLVSLLKK